MREFLQNNRELGIALMVLVIIIFTQLFKIPIKHGTSKLKNEKLRKGLNGLITLLAVGVAILVEWAYSAIIKAPFKIEVGIIFASLGMSSHDFLELFKNLFGYVIAHIKSKKKINVSEINDIISDSLSQDSKDVIEQKPTNIEPLLTEEEQEEKKTLAFNISLFEKRLNDEGK